MFQEGRLQLAVVRATLAHLGLVLVLLAALAVAAHLGVPVAAGASPVPIATPFDPRAEGEGPGLVGAPLLAAAVVLALGVATSVLTYLYVRLSRQRR